MNTTINTVDMTPFERVIDEKFGPIKKPHPDEINITCPKCNGKDKLFFNTTKRLYNCFKCGAGTTTSWLVDVLGYTRRDAFMLLIGRPIETLDRFHDVLRGLFSTVSVDHAVNKPNCIDGSTIKHYLNDFIPIGIGNMLADTIGGEYMKSRGFSLDHCRAWGLMYAHTGKFRDRIIIPIWQNGNLVYFQGRSITNHQNKYYNPSITTDNVCKNDFIFNIDTAKQYETIYICEGAFNAMSIGPCACALFGKTLSLTQYEQIITKINKTSNIVICLDYGAEQEALNIVNQLSTHFKTFMLIMPTKDDINTTLTNYGYKYVHDLLTKHVHPANTALSSCLLYGRLLNK